MKVWVIGWLQCVDVVLWDLLGGIDVSVVRVDHQFLIAVVEEVALPTYSDSCQHAHLDALSQSYEAD